MNKEINARIEMIMSRYGLDQLSFANACGLNKFTVNRYMNSKTWSDKSLRKVTKAFNLNFAWLRDGIGEMFDEAKREGEIHAENLAAYMASLGHTTVNTINGENNSGTQTINLPDKLREEAAALRTEVEMLRKIIEDKDKTIALLEGLLKK